MVLFQGLCTYCFFCLEHSWKSAQLAASLLSSLHSNDTFSVRLSPSPCLKFSTPALPTLPVPTCLFYFSPLFALITNCDGSFYVSTWLGHGVPRYLAKHYLWVCLWGCFCMRLTFETGRPEKSRLPSPMWMGLTQSIESLNMIKGWGRKKFFLSAVRDISSLLPLDLDLDWNYLYHWLSWGSSLPTARLGLLKPPKLREPIPYSKSLYVCIHILFVLFLWRTQTNTPTNSILSLFKKKIVGLPPCQRKLHEGRDFCPFCSLLYPKHNAWYLINICWMNNGPYNCTLFVCLVYVCGCVCVSPRSLWHTAPQNGLCSPNARQSAHH